MIIRNFPTDEEINEIYDKIPHDRMEYIPISGLFRQELRLAGQPVETIERSEEEADRFAGYYMYAYLPEDLPQGANGILVLCSEEDAAEFLDRSGWLALADREKIAVFGLSSPFGWNDKDQDLAIAKRAKDVLTDRKYYDVSKIRVYIAAYGKAAPTGERMILSSPDTISGLALIGPDGCSAEELAKLGEEPSKVSWIKIKDVACPLHIFTDELTEENAAARDFFIGCNRLEPEAYVRNGVKYYIHDRRNDVNWVRSENCTYMAVYEDKDLCADSPKTTEHVWEELRTCYRTLDYLNSSIHASRCKDSFGAIHRTMEIDGWLRSWEEFVPARAKRGLKCPLVVELHGGSGTPIHAMQTGGWIKVANERAFFLATPYGSLRRFKSGTMPHPAWNANGKSAEQDDYKFIREIIADMCDRYPQIDKTRIYITGHSMGSAMTLQAAVKMSDLFAAAASNSGVIRGGFYGGMEAPPEMEKYRMPIIIQMGELDRGGGTYEVNVDIKNTMEYFISRNNCGNVDEPMEYVNGLMHHKVYHDPEGVPSTHFIMTENKPHCQTYQDSLMYYDEFLCKFSRQEDGTICYMGRPVK